MTVTETAAVRFPGLRECPFGPPVAYANMTRAAIGPDREAWLVTRYDDARAVLGDPRFSAAMTSPGFPIPPRRSSAIDVSFLRMDDPEHSRYRRMFAREFTVKRTDELGPVIQRLTDRLVDDLTAGPEPADLVRALALPLPMRVICELLGVPYADHPFFEKRGNALVDLRNGLQQFEEAVTDLRGYMDGLIEAREREPGIDMLSRIVVAQLRTGEFTRQQLTAATLVLLIGGFETTASMISLGALALLEHPEQWAALRKDPRLLPAAVEELLRYLTVMQFGVPRAALEDVALGGRTIRAGEGVMVLLPDANWDGDAFDEPDRLDVHREGPPQLAFGHGVHGCIGAQLARAELRIAFGTLLRRMPELRLAGRLEALTFCNYRLIYGVEELPVTWRY
jgi:cytochrome P450